MSRDSPLVHQVRQRSGQGLWAAATLAAVALAVAMLGRGRVSRPVLGMAVSAVALLVLRALSVAARRMRQPLGHPAVRRQLAHLGDPLVTTARIEQELVAPGVRAFGSARLTAHWLVGQRMGPRLIPLSDIVWVQPIERRWTRASEGRPARRASVRVYSSDGRQHRRPLVITLERAARDELAALLRRVAPHAISGHRPEVALRWRRTRRELVALVESRRDQARPPAAPRPRPRRIAPPEGSSVEL
jgi:hypothetical protein